MTVNPTKAAVAVKDAIRVLDINWQKKGVIQKITPPAARADWMKQLGKNRD